MRGKLAFFVARRRIGTVVTLTVALIAGWAIYRTWRVPRLNVILVTLDTTRADHLGVYGYQQGLTSGLDKFAERGVIFDRAYSPAPLTLPSHATMLTGLYPPEHGLRVNDDGQLANSVPLLPEILRRHGYDTGAFISAFVLNRKFGLARGFNTYDDDLSQQSAQKKFNERRRDGQDIMSSALSWLQPRTSRPFFCWIHLYDAHGLYDMRSDLFGKKFELNPYDAGIAVESTQFERLIAFLQEHKLREKTLIIVAGDHGEGLNEHLECEHGMLVYNSTLHVPFVFAGPPECQPGTRVDRAVSLADLTPTVLDLLKIPAPGPMSGRSLLPALKGQPISSANSYGEAQLPFLLNRWCPLQTVISERWKYIESTRPELYDLLNDPGETNNLAQSAADECQQLRNILESIQESFVCQDAQKLRLSEEDSAKLGALGYVAGGRSSAMDRTSTNTLTDIKDVLPLLAKYDKAKHLGLQGKFEDAIALAEEIVHQKNDYTTAYVLLGECYQAAKRPAETVAAYRTALELQPDLSKVRLNLARVLASQGQFEQAKNEYEELIKQDPEIALLYGELADVLIALKRFDEALVQFREAIRVDPQSVTAQLSLGQFLLKIKRPKDAVTTFEQLVRSDPGNAEAQSGLSNAFVQLGEYGSALKPAKKAAELAPKSFEVRMNLGNLLVSQNRPEEGIAEYCEARKLRPDDPRPQQHIHQVEAALKRGR